MGSPDIKRNISVWVGVLGDDLWVGYWRDIMRVGLSVGYDCWGMLGGEDYYKHFIPNVSNHAILNFKVIPCFQN